MKFYNSNIMAPSNIFWLSKWTKWIVTDIWFQLYSIYVYILCLFSIFIWNFVMKGRTHNKCGIEFRARILSNSWTYSFHNLHPFWICATLCIWKEATIQSQCCSPNCIPNIRWFEIFLKFKYCNDISTSNSIIGLWTVNPNSK